MATVKHTPGPWTEPRTYQNIDGAISMIAIYGDQGEKTVYHMTGGELSASRLDTTLANARLIAAAPLLLEALEAIADREQDWGDVNVWDGLDDHTVRNFAAAAIKAAEG